MTWSQILAETPTVARLRARFPQALTECAELCIDNLDCLAPWERGFEGSIASRPVHRFSLKETDVVDGLTRFIMLQRRAA